MNDENLIPFDPNDPESVKKAREMGRKGGIKSGEAKRRKKLMSLIYAEFLEKEHDIIRKDGTREKIDGTKLLNRVMSEVLSRGDSASVSLMREIREGTEGSNINVDFSGGARRLIDYMSEEQVDNYAEQVKDSEEVKQNGGQKDE